MIYLGVVNDSYTEELNVFKACVGALSIYKKIAKETKRKTKQNQIFTVGLCPFLFPDYQKRRMFMFLL